MKKQAIKLTEGDLHRIIKESVNKVLKEKNTNLEFYIQQNYPSKVKEKYFLRQIKIKGICH